MTDTASTSARLRQLQQDYAASQADLTRVKGELDWAREVVEMLRKNETIRAQVIRERNAERDLLRAELASARTELEQLRRSAHWIVARDTGPACERCDQPVQRGQAYELLADIDTVRHIHCDAASASAQLQAFAASQADLTRVKGEMAAWQGILIRVERERDEARDELARLRAAVIDSLNRRAD